MGLVITLIGGLFMWDNQQFFGTAETQYEEGYRWEYIGKTPTSGVPALPIIDNQDNEVVYWKLNK